jgi:hypothetical protein
VAAPLSASKSALTMARREFQLCYVSQKVDFRDTFL